MAKSGTIKSWDFLEFLKAFLFIRSKMSKINKDNYALIMNNATSIKPMA